MKDCIISSSCLGSSLLEKAGEFAPKFVNDYAQAHPEKVFTGEDGRDKFVEMESEAFRIILGDYVTTEDGTGIVHIAPTFGADDAKVAKDANIPALYLISKKGETRPMVDLQGKYYPIDELDKNFVKACVDEKAYGHHAGDYVKNSYDPKFNPDGVWDKKASEKAEDLNIIICMEMKQEGSASTFKSTYITIHTAGVRTSLYSIIHSIVGLSRIQRRRNGWLNSIKRFVGSLNQQVQDALVTGLRTLMTGILAVHASGEHHCLYGEMRTVVRNVLVL